MILTARGLPEALASGRSEPSGVGRAWAPPRLALSPLRKSSSPPLWGVSPSVKTGLELAESACSAPGEGCGVRRARLGPLKAQGTGFGDRLATSDQSCWTSGPPTVPLWRSGTYVRSRETPTLALPVARAWGGVRAAGRMAPRHSAVGLVEPHCHSCGTATPFLLLWGDIHLHQQMQVAPSGCSLFWGGL